MSYALKMEAFSLTSADALIGQRVKLVADVPYRERGETGVIKSHVPWRNGHAILVEWDTPYTNGRGRLDYFSKAEYEAYLQEI